MASLGTPDPQVQTDALSQAPAPAPADTSAVPSPQAAPGKPSLWKGILEGALTGLAGAKGATSFGGGLAGGAAGVLAEKAQAQDDALKQRQAAREDKSLELTAKLSGVQAAEALSRAAMNNKRLSQMDTEARDAHTQMTVGLMEHLQNMGVTPDIVADDSHDGTVSALNQYGDKNGQVGHMMYLDLGGQHMAYNLDKMAGGPQALTIINGVPGAHVTPEQWASTPPAAKTQAMEKAAKYWAPDNAKSAQEANGQRLGYQSDLDTLKKNPNADPEQVKSLTQLVGKLNTRYEGMVAGENRIKAGDAYAQAKAQKDARLDADKEEYQKLASGDVTGWTPRSGANMSQQQFNAANTKFTSGRLNAANSTEAGYEMFQQAYANRKDAKTGAGSMLALASHMGTTFGTLKGMRQTQDIIHEHQNAKNIQDKAETYANKLKNGDILSDNQWTEFGDLIKHARTLAWKNTINEAHSMGLPVTEPMLPADIRGGEQTSSKHSDLGFVPSKGN